MYINKVNDILELIENKLVNTYGRWLGIKDVCKYTSLSESTIRRAIKQGNLKVSHKTGKLLFNINDIKRWLNG